MTPAPADAEERSSIISLAASPLTTQPPARSSPEIVSDPDPDEDGLQYPVSNAFQFNSMALFTDCVTVARFAVLRTYSHSYFVERG